MDALSIQTKVAEAISNSGKEVTDIVIDRLAGVEKAKRVDLIIKGIAKIANLEKDLKKIDRKDTSYYTEIGEGSAKIETYSEQRYKDITAAKEAITKMRGLVDKALATNTADDYGKLQVALEKDQKGGNDAK